MRKQIFSVIFLMFIHFVSSQNEQVRFLVEKTKDLKLDMWDLVEYAQKNIKDENQLAYFFYYWIGSNIKYDNKTLNQYDKGILSNEKFYELQKDINVFENKKGVCAGYANLFEWFMFEVDIEVVIVSGHIRDKRNHYVELNLDDDFRHAWNAIKIKNKWILIDTTWGTSNNSEISDFYFDMKPEFTIITHFPKEQKWQLLETPLSLEEFNNSKFISPIWFFKGFSDIPKLKSDKDNYYFIYKMNLNSWTVNLLYSIDNVNFKPIENIKIINQEGFTYLKFPKRQMPSHIYFKVNLFKKTSQIWTKYNDVINFKI